MRFVVALLIALYMVHALTAGVTITDNRPIPEEGHHASD